MSFPTISQANQTSMESVQNRPLVLNEGQLFHGRIHRLLPGQMAEVQIGDQKLFAKLEVPLKAGDAYYFQVNAVKPELQLKIIAGPLAVADGKALPLTGLLDALQLPKSAEMQTLLSFIIKNKVPLTRSELLVAEQFLKSIPTSSQQGALTSIQKMAENKLPFTENIFRAVFGVESKQGLHETLTNLRQVLQTDTTLPPQTKSDLLASLDQVSKPFGQIVGGQILAQSVLTLLNNETAPEVRFQVLQLLKDAGIMPRTASLANLNQVLSSLQNTQVAANNSLPTNQQQPANNRVTQPEQVPNLLRTLAENVISNPFRMDTNGLGLKEQLLQFLGQSPTNQSEPLTQLLRLTETNHQDIIRSMVQTAETSAHTAVDGKVIQEAIKSIVQTLGVQYEANLNTRDTNFTQLLHQLKPQLIALIQDPATAAAIRDSAEVLVTRMNGPLLVSGENVIQHQLIMQIPLELFGKKIDATLQWNGRMQEDGKIDADFARILFYLDLHSLKETIVDMQVQNRVVTLNIFNEDPTIKAIGTLFHQNLKSGLENLGYRLSGIFFKTFEEKQKQVQKPKQQLGLVEGQGVDFRI